VIKKLRKNIILAIIVSAVIYLALTIYADIDSVFKALEIFPFYILPLVLLLAFGNYSVRFLKWHYYLRKLNVQISVKESYHIFMSGLIMSVTPGKFGEVMKSYLVKFNTGEPVSKTIPVMIVERITDFYSLLIIALLGAFYFDYGKVVVLVVTLLFVLLTVVINQKNLSLKIIYSMEKIRFLKKYVKNFRMAYESAYTLLKIKPLYEMTLLSVVAWSLECFAFYIILVNFSLNVSIPWSLFIYAFATIVGSITLLPAGLGVTDGSLTYFIYKIASKMDIAVAATLVTRLATLWFAVAIGIFSLWLYKKKNADILDLTEEERNS
jgi:uncharacterized protein (TIRG00374 family)